ncbi:MAG TPA: hypothetical protein VK858_12285 [Longimicrobiales bacterium]|nr:hypothetical protein [Longimicrobiales bacterium]
MAGQTSGPSGTGTTPPAPERVLDEILVEVRMGRLSRATMPAWTDGLATLLPLNRFLELAEVEFVVDSLGVTRATLHPRQREVVVDPVLPAVRVAGRPLDVSPGDVVELDGTTYVAAPVLERMLDLDLLMDWTDLSVVVLDPRFLPLGQRLAREARWRALLSRTELGTEAERVELGQAPWGGAVLDWDLYSDLERPVESTAYSVGLGARYLDGDLRMSVRSLGPASEGVHRVDATYQAVFEDRDWIKQLRLGDGFGTGPRFRDMRGVALTNAPYARPTFFGLDAVSGRVGPGWEVELRQSGQTLDLTRADEQGAFALDIPLNYGENSVQVVAFGPHGQVVTSDRVFLLSSERLPAGQLEWGVSGGACRSERCGWTGNADLWYGISEGWTVRGGTEAFGRDTLPALVQPYLGVTGTVVRGLELSTEAVYRGYLRGGLLYAPSTRIRVRGAYTDFSSAEANPVLHDARRRNTTEADVFFRPMADNPRVYARGSFLRQALITGNLTRIQLAAMVPVGRLGVEAGFRRVMDAPLEGPRRATNNPFGAVSGLVPLGPRRRLWVRGEVETDGLRRLSRVRGQAAVQLPHGVRLQVGAGWQEALGSSLDIGISAVLDALQSTTQMASGRGAPTRITQLTRGSVNWNEATGSVTLTRGPGLQRGGISGHVFVDRNGNGILDSDEAGLEGVRLVVGGQAVTTDARGRYNAWDLLPFRPVRLWADSTSIDDPTLVPARGQVEVVVPPSSFGRVDVAVSPSREVTGRAVRFVDGRDTPLPSASLQLVYLKTGEARPLRTFSDGEFYVSGVRPGRYELRLDPDYAARFGLERFGGHARFAVPPGAEDLSIIGPVVLRVASVDGGAPRP